MELRTFSVYDIFKRNAKNVPGSVAVVFGDRRVTYAELLVEVNRMASGLASLGVGKGDRVAVLSHNRPEYVAAFGAVAALGAIIVPVNWRLSAEECKHVVEDTTPRASICDENCRERMEEIVEMGAPVGRPVSVTPCDEDWVCLSDLPGDDAPTLAEVAADDPYCVIHTAAVEGKARGAVLTHGNVIYGNMQALAVMGLAREPVHLSMLPLFHITGVNLTLTTAHAGGRNVIMEKFDAERAVQSIRDEGVTLLASFPPILATLTERIQAEGGGADTLAHVLGIDSPDNIKAFEETTGATFWCLYGQTETSGPVTFSPARERPGSAGQPGPLTDVRLADDGDRDVPLGENGEILVRGPLVFAGYWNKDEVNRHTFRDGWHHTGDIGRFDEGGYLWFGGRKPEKDLIKPGGENVYPAEVEAACLEHPGMAEVCVIGVPDRKWGEGIKAVCVRKPGQEFSAEDLIAFVGGRIARYKKPQYVAFVEALPKTAAGVVDRIRVKEEHGENQAGPTSGT
ncbi:MAG: AMP-binding protein [Desulfatibacillaceae bacterium]